MSRLIVKSLENVTHTNSVAPIWKTNKIWAAVGQINIK